MFRSINGPSSGPQGLRSMQIHVKFMEVLQLDGVPSVLQFERMTPAVSGLPVEHSCEIQTSTAENSI